MEQTVAVAGKATNNNERRAANLKAQTKKKHKRNRQLAYLIHEKLYLTFGQCVQLLDTHHNGGHLIANRNINKTNRKNIDNKDFVPLAEFDAGTFNDLLAEQIEFAKSSKEFTI